MRTCSICLKEITSKDSWHGDGLGHYHIRCEWRVRRAKEGLLPRPPQVHFELKPNYQAQSAY